MPLFPPEKVLIARRFGCRASCYDDVTPVQTRLWQSLAETIDPHVFPREPANILELGCGTGALTSWLCCRYPMAQITAVDLAPEMAAATREKCPRVQVIVADAEAYVEQHQEPFDLICSSATAQWFARPGETLLRCRKLLRPGGLLAIGTFGDATFRELRESFAVVEPASCRVLQPPPAAYWRSLFQDADVEEALAVLTFPGVREFLASVKMAGANAVPSAHSHPLRRPVYEAMLHEYQQRFAVPGGIAATYHLITLRVEAAS